MGVTPGLVSKGLSLARLPPEVLAAFERPQDVRYGFAVPLKKALEEDADAVFKRARALAAEESSRTSKVVFDLLVGNEHACTDESEPIVVNGMTVAVLKERQSLGESLEFCQPLGDKRKQKLVLAVKKIFSGTARNVSVRRRNKSPTQDCSPG